MASVGSLNTYINPRYIPEDKTTEKEKLQNAWKAILLANKRGMPETQSYRNRSNMIQQGGLDATLYETRQRDARQQAYLDRQQRNLQSMNPRQIGVNVNLPNVQGFNPGGGNNVGSNAKGGPTPSGTFGKFIAAITGQESGGNYNARNGSSGAMGRYQIMPGNLGGKHSGWDYEALGYDVSPGQFMGSPQIQDAIAQYKLRQYYQKWGPWGAAVAWYAGPGAVGRANKNKSQGAYPTINNYANSILRRMGL